MSGDTTVPDIADTLLGFRAWKWEPERARLTSVTRSDEWIPGQDMHPRCGQHPAAAPGCSCGIYAARTVDRVAPYTGQGLALGLVWGWGDRVVRATDGFRSEHARIA